MLKRIKRSLGVDPSPRPTPADYQAIDGDDAESSSAGVRTRSAPDNGGQVYWAFWALGAGVLLSWNVLICSFPLLASFFSEGSSHRTNLASYLSTVYCFGNLFFLGISQRTVSTTSPESRIRWSLTLLITTSLLFSFPIIHFLIPPLSSSPNLLLSLLIITSAILALSTAYLQSGVFALSALWPTSTSSSATNATLAVMSGQGGIAVLVSATQLVLAAIGALNGSSAGGEKPSARTGIVLWVLAGAGGLGCQAALRYICAQREFGEVVSQVDQRREDGVKGDGDRGRTKSILRKNARLELAVAWVFTVTLSVFPPLTTAIVSTHEPTPKLLQPAVFIPFHFLIFNIGDYLGRTYLPRLYLPTSQNTVLSLSLSRTLLIPLFLLCNVNVSGTSSSTFIPWINSDFAYFAVLLVFGLTNGWVSSLCMILASNPVLNRRIQEGEKDVAGTLAAFCLVSGLAAGSVASFGVNWIVRGSFV